MKILPLATVFTLMLVSGTSRAQSTGNDSLLSYADKIFVPVEVEATYPGGPSAWLRFLTKTVDGSIPTNNNAPAGTYTVVVQFIVDRDSSITDFKALTNHGYGMEQEVIRALRLSGKWLPAIQHGKPVKAYRKQPVTFRVEMEDMEIDTGINGALVLKKENLVKVRVNKVKDEDLLVTVSHGTVTKSGNGQYIIKVTKKDRVIIRVYNSRKDKEIGAAIFDVKD